MGTGVQATWTLALLSAMKRQCASSTAPSTRVSSVTHDDDAKGTRSERGERESRGMGGVRCESERSR